MAIIYLNGQYLPSQKQMNKPDPAHKDNNEFDLGQFWFVQLTLD